MARLHPDVPVDTTGYRQSRFGWYRSHDGYCILAVYAHEKMVKTNECQWSTSYHGLLLREGESICLRREFPELVTTKMMCSRPCPDEDLDDGDEFCEMQRDGYGTSLFEYLADLNDAGFSLEYCDRVRRTYQRREAK